jgi:hypothetical protein
MLRSGALPRWAVAIALVAPFIALVVWWPGPRPESRWLALALYLPIYLWSVWRDIADSAAVEDP